MLSDKEKRKEYNRLGEAGVAASMQTVIDHKYILMQLIIYYTSSAVFAFFMTFTEPTGDAFSISLFGLLSKNNQPSSIILNLNYDILYILFYYLIAMLLIELLFVTQEVPLPDWLLPYNTAHDVISVLHRLFPAFMNGCRCIIGAFYIDRKAQRIEVLDQVCSIVKEANIRAANICQTMIYRIEQHQQNITRQDDNGATAGMMEKDLCNARRNVMSMREGRNGTLISGIKKQMKLISDPAFLFKKRNANTTEDDEESGWILLRNLSLYLLARFLFIKGSQLK